MAKTSFIDLTPEISDLYFSGLKSGDRFTFSRIGRKNTLISRKTKKGISEKSLLPEISIAWATLSSAEKQAWADAGAECDLTNWRLFIQDYCARRVNDLPGLATPSLFHQSWVGCVHIGTPATEAKFIQAHPRNYYISRKVTGTKSMYSPVLITEDITLPLSITINYKSELTPVVGVPRAQFVATIYYSYQGRNLSHDVIIPFDYSCEWKTATASISSLVSYVYGYDLFLNFNGLQGDFYFDNIKVEHGGQNWCRDPFCKDVNQGFTRNYYQVSKHWSGVYVPSGVVLESVYKDFIT